MFKLIMEKNKKICPICLVRTIEEGCLHDTYERCCMECRSDNNLVALTPIPLAEKKEWMKYVCYAFSNFIYIQNSREFWSNDECVHKHEEPLYHVCNNYFYFFDNKYKIYKFDIETKKLVYLKHITSNCYSGHLFFFEDKYIMISHNNEKLTIQRESLLPVEINFQIKCYLLGILFYNIEKVIFCVRLIYDGTFRTMKYDFTSGSLTIIAEETCKFYNVYKRCDGGMWMIEGNSNLLFVNQFGNIKVFKNQREIYEIFMMNESTGYAWNNIESIYHVQTYNGKKQKNLSHLFGANH